MTAARSISRHQGQVPAFAELEAALRTGPGLPTANLDYFAEFLDVTRFLDRDLDRTWSDLLARKYAGRDIRVVITAGPEAREFWIKHRDALFPNVPVVVVADRMDTPGARRCTSRFLPPHSRNSPTTFSRAAGPLEP